MAQSVLIAGASVRAAAQSAVRAGLCVTAADLFCDRDLVACSDARAVPDYPQGIVAMANQLPRMEWFYTGGLENEPALVDAVSRHHLLLGQPGEVLRAVRDPWRVRDVLARAGLHHPGAEHRPPPGSAGKYVVKPLRSCAGVRVQLCAPDGTIWSDAAMDPTGTDEHAGGVYYQQWISGPSYGATFLTAGDRAVLLGVSRQLMGCGWAGACGFRYVGSIGPVAVDASTTDQLQRIGQRLAAAFSLRGLVGVDVVLSGSDVWTIEVNPRYSASIEVLERATGLSAVQFHRDACLDGALPRELPESSSVLWGKAVVYARQAVTISPEFSRHLDTIRARESDWGVADLPQTGICIRAGEPVLTVLARASDVRGVHRRLRTCAGQIYRLLATTCAAGPLPHEPAARVP